MHFSLKALFFLTIPFSLFLSRPTQAEFITLGADKKKFCSHQLNEVKNIAYQCQIITDSSNSLKVWQDRVSFQFGKLSAAEFNHLNSIYSGWSESKSAVTYSRDRDYQLIDFLPPIIQALDSHRFIPESTKLRNHNLEKNLPADTQKQIYMNCWGVIYEVLRMAYDPQTQPAIFMGQGSIVLDLLRENSEQLMAFQEPGNDIPSSMTQPGDIILIMHQSSTGQEYLDHIAIMIDDGIYFEKAGTGAEVPIRIIDEETIRQIWQPGVFDYEVRRPIPDASFPHAEKVFSLDAPLIQQEFTQLNPVPNKLARNTSIMWEEETKKLETISWFGIINPLSISTNIAGKARLESFMYQPLID